MTETWTDEHTRRHIVGQTVQDMAACLKLLDLTSDERSLVREASIAINDAYDRLAPSPE